MNYYLGIDIGTSGTKAVLFNSLGIAIDSASREYELLTLKLGFSEERPADWLWATEEVIKELTSKGYEIKGIGLSGQMHGLVLLDENDKVLRNSIIWCDNRAVKEAAQIALDIGEDTVKEITGNEVVAAFTFAKLLWVKNNEPEIYKKIAKVLLPKDYVRYMLTGDFASEYSDASGMQLIDLKTKDFSSKLLDYLGLKRSNFARLGQSKDKLGIIKPDKAQKLGLKNDCYFVGGAGDQAAAAIGNGILKKGDLSIVLGSSGVVFSPLAYEDVKKTDGLQVFMHAVEDTYHVMGVTNGCGLSYKWFKENIGMADYDKLNEMAKSSVPLASGLIYLPYLNGERTPHLDPYATGTFIGITQNTTKGDMTRAILEGVAYSLKDCFELLPFKPNNILVSGGGAKGKLWQEIIASVLGLPISRINQEEGGALGVAILAMVAGGEYESIAEACQKIIAVNDTTLPNILWQEKYQVGYELYRSAYRHLKDYYKKSYEMLYGGKR